MTRKGYNPNQPRDEWGRWTDDPATNEVVKGMFAGALLPTSVDKALEETDAYLSTLRYEHLFVHDINTGEELANKTTYSTNSVSLREDVKTDKEIIDKFKGNIVTHNHPFSNQPYSSTDIYLFSRTSTKIGRVVGRDYIFELEPVMKWETFRKLEDYLQVKGEAVAHALDFLGLTSKDLYLARTDWETVEQFNIVVMGMIAKEYGWQFRVKDNPNEPKNRYD